MVCVFSTVPFYRYSKTNGYSSEAIQYCRLPIWHVRRPTSPRAMMTSSNGNIFRVTDLLCGEWNSPATGEFPAQRPVKRSFGVFFDLRMNKRLSKQSRGWWFEAPSPSLWRQRNAMWFHKPFRLIAYKQNHITGNKSQKQFLKKLCRTLQRALWLLNSP